MNGWNKISETRPEDGQEVVCCNLSGDVWTETWFNDEPIGSTHWWIPVPGDNDDS